MRDVQELAIERSILHLVAPKGRGLVVSERELPLADNPVAAFFEGHLLRGLRDSQTRAANFVTISAGRPAGWIQRLFSQPDEFLDLSRRIARRLHDVMAQDARVSDGTLAVITYSGLNDGVRTEFVSLLKLDPTDAFRPVTRTDQSGLTYVDLEIEHDIMPTTRERLHKSAFVRSADESIDYHLLVLDRQTEAAAARFFIADFLGAELAFDDRRRTEAFYRAVQTARSQVAPRLAAADLKALDDSIGGAMAGRAINLEEWIPTLPVGDEEREIFERAIGESLPDRQFDLDEDIRRRFVRRRRFEGDNGLVVNVDARFFDGMVEIEDVPNTDPPVRRVVITTQKWREVL